MTSKIRFVVAIDMLFLLLLILSGSSVGITSEILYYLAFIGPVGLAINYVYNPGKSSHVSADEVKKAMLDDLKSDFSLTKENALFTLPLIVPTIIMVLGVSLITSLFMNFLGYSDPSVFDEPFALAVITHALIPAILEELLFRFAPIKILSENKKTALLVSSVMFAFAHANLFRIPYALVAGFIFSAIYMLTGSILPSMLIHFLNNLFSLLSIYGYIKLYLYYPIVFVLFITSVIFIYKKRKHYVNKITELLQSEEKVKLSYHPLIFIGTSLVLAISLLFA
ncbi:MAG: CPBP family intramembrane metalloprotease [Ruminococcaceae bacterium]|nr:CPBP family intramembrane metalloprotease [Oscillospiraceae bacterium]